MPRSSREAPTPEQFLSGFPPEIAALSNHLRGLIRRAVPDPIEAVYLGWKLIGYRVRDGARDRYFGYIAPLAGHVSLGFEYGVLLRDPRGLLGGSGRQVRAATLRPGNTPNDDALVELIAEAAHVAATLKRRA